MMHLISWGQHVEVWLVPRLVREHLSDEAQRQLLRLSSEVHPNPHHNLQHTSMHLLCQWRTGARCTWVICVFLELYIPTRLNMQSKDKEAGTSKAEPTLMIASGGTTIMASPAAMSSVANNPRSPLLPRFTSHLACNAQRQQQTSRVLAACPLYNLQ